MNRFLPLISCAFVGILVSSVLKSAQGSPKPAYGSTSGTPHRSAKHHHVALAQVPLRHPRPASEGHRDCSVPGTTLRPRMLRRPIRITSQQTLMPQHPANRDTDLRISNRLLLSEPRRREGAGFRRDRVVRQYLELEVDRRAFADGDLPNLLHVSDTRPSIISSVRGSQRCCACSSARPFRLRAPGSVAPHRDLPGRGPCTPLEVRVSARDVDLTAVDRRGSSKGPAPGAVLPAMTLARSRPYYWAERCRSGAAGPPT